MACSSLLIAPFIFFIVTVSAFEMPTFKKQRVDLTEKSILDMLSRMTPGAVLVDVAIDQGGCFETSHATTHDDPTYIVDEVMHYCVANMPGAVARTSAAALNNATLPYVLELADKGVEAAMKSNVHLLHGLNVYHGEVTNEGVGAAHGIKVVSPEVLLAA